MKINYKNLKYALKAIDRDDSLCYNRGWYRSKEERSNIINKNFLKKLTLQEERDLQLTLD